MKKKLLSLLLVGSMVLSMTACGGAKTEDATKDQEAVATEATEDNQEDAAETSEADNGGEKKEAGDIKIGMVTDVGGINDQSFNQTSWEGLQKAHDDLGIQVTYMESHTDADYKTNLETLVDENCDLIISVGYMLADATKEVAEEYPDQKFAIVDDASMADVPNVASLIFEQAQVSYLAGAVAATMTKTNNVGFVIGMATGPMNEFGYGYVAGVHDTNDKCVVQQYDANSFADPSLGKSAVVDMKTKGADIVFHAAGGTGNGVIEACKEEKIYAIGVDKDQSVLAPETVITSALKRVDTATYDVAKSILENTYTAGVHKYDLAEGGVDIAPTQDLLTPEAKEAVEKAKKGILDGSIVVPSTKEDFEAKYGPDLYTLD